MLTVTQDQPLRTFNTFGCVAYAERYIAFTELAELQELLREHYLAGPRLILSGGSNLLLMDSIAGTVLQPLLSGIRFHDESPAHVLVTAGAGENWHGLVMASLHAGYSGLENLALIPGNVGAAPVQNIGAYGVELSERVVSVEAVDLDTGEALAFSAEQCGFGYRESVFKQGLKDRVLITAVTLRLDRQARLNTRYGAIEAELAARKLSAPTALDVCEAVCSIRRSKLPDPAVLGNAGSFFKNPSVSAEHHARLRDQEPGLVAYLLADGRYKLAAGWLIERCGFKGERRGAVGVHEHQSLVLVNYGGGTGAQILALAREIQAAVAERFGVDLSPEVRIVPQFP